jgi:protein SCO1/2
MTMQTTDRGGWKRTAMAVCAVLLAAPLFVSAASAQVSSYGDKQAGENQGDQRSPVLDKIGVTQKLNQQLPLDAQFVDDQNKPVKLGDYFGKHPAVISLVYYNCPILCSEEMDGLTSALEMVKLTPGKDFEIIFISIDPSETYLDAAKKKAFYVKRYGRPETANGWHFLTGQKPAIDAVSAATGYGYVRVPGPDGRMTQFAHASSVELATTNGKLAQYYLGVDFSPKDMLLGLIDASGNKIGSPVANILTYCYHYDPETNKHSLIVARVVQFGGMVTMAGLGGFIFLMFRRDLKLGREHNLTADRSGGRNDKRTGSNRRYEG